MWNLIKNRLRQHSLQTGKLKSLYIKICNPGGHEFAVFMKRHGGLHAVGEDVFININAVITDPAYVRIGSNCTLSDCTLLGHDGVIRILNNAYGKKLDSVGKIDIRDNVFVGHGAIVMPGITIGPNSIVSAGSVVTKDVPPGMIVGGVPSKVIGTTDDLVERLQARTDSYPWRDLILDREGAFDPEIEPELVRMRVAHFYGD